MKGPGHVWCRWSSPSRRRVEEGWRRGEDEDSEKEQQILSPGSLHVYSAVSCGAPCSVVLCVGSREEVACRRKRRRKSGGGGLL